MPEKMKNGLEIFTLEQREQWDTVVATFADHDVYYLSGYPRAFQIHGDGEPLLFHYDDGAVRGISVVMRRDIADAPSLRGKLEKGRWFDFATPYGYGGWLIEGGDSAPLFQAYEAWCARHNVVSEFVRFHPVLGNHVHSQEAYEVIPLGETVAMDLSSPTCIWENLTAKNRNVIRKAEKNGVRIFQGRCPGIFEVFRDIYNGTMDKDHAVPYYYFGEEFYRSILDDLPCNAQVFYAELDGKIIASSIILGANRRLNYHLSGSLLEYSSLAATNLLLYRAALWGCANGYRTLHLGGGVGSGEDGLFKFKRAFYRGDHLPRFHIGRKIFNMEKYQEFVGMRGEIPDTGFFPKYRA